MSEEKETKKEDTHGSPAMTRWVHHHRRLAKWLFKGLVVAFTSMLYYLKKQEKIIEKEAKKES